MDRKFLIKEDRQRESISEMSGDDYHKAHFKWWVHMDEYRLHNYESIGCSDFVRQSWCEFFVPEIMPCLHRDWKDHSKCNDLLSTVFTESDEEFARQVIKHNANKWYSHYRETPDFLRNKTKLANAKMDPAVFEAAANILVSTRQNKFSKKWEEAFQSYISKAPEVSQQAIPNDVAEPEEPDISGQFRHMAAAADENWDEEDDNKH